MSKRPERQPGLCLQDRQISLQITILNENKMHMLGSENVSRAETAGPAGSLPGSELVLHDKGPMGNAFFGLSQLIQFLPCLSQIQGERSRHH